MVIFEIFKQAVDSLRANKMRSLLTMLGIVMGVFSVIAIMAIGNATESYIISEFEKIGANTVNIYYKGTDITRNEWLTLEDIDLLTENIPEIKNITTIGQWYGQFRIGNKTRDALIYAVTAQYKNFSVIDMVEGRFINSFDDTARALVVVVDEAFAKRYFNKTDIIGEELNLNLNRYNLKVKVIGVIKTGDDLFSGLMDNELAPTMIYMPVRTVQSITNYKRLDTILFSVNKDADVHVIGNKVLRLLERVHRKEDIYMLQTVEDVQKMFSSIIGVVTSALLVIAIITLIVGGIGIINILLVSVTERIREIGIRKALGAKKKDIILQFLMESVIMTGFAGIIGIIIGVIAGNVLSGLIKIPPAVDIPTIIISFSMSVVLGLIFGVYPAKKAADLDPIEALRYE